MHLALMASLLGIVAPNVHAGQVAYQVIPAASAQHDAQPTKKSTSVRITMAVQDSTLKYVVNEILRRTGLRPVYNTSSTVFARRVTLRLDNLTVQEALTAALKGTGLVAKFVSDRETVMIRPREDTLKGRDRAATGTIVGRVTDSANKHGVPRAVVTVIGTKLSAVTEDNGTFRITKTPVGPQILSVRLLGYASKTIEVTVDSAVPVTVNIVLHATSTTLSEVVTTATGRQRRVEVATDIATINADSLLKVSPVTSVTDLLAVARIPGVIVTPSSGIPGSPSRIRLGGIGSISQSNDPVVIVDGIWINAPTSTSAIQRNTGMGDGINQAQQYKSSRLDDIDPNSIESIEVIRGPSATALYGTNAANGVIVITTKRGHSGPTRWNVSLNHSWNDVPGRYQPVYRGYGLDLRTGNTGYPCNVNDVLAMSCIQDSISMFNPKNAPLTTNEASGWNTGASVGMNGGTATVQYALTGSYQDQLGPTKLPIVDRIRFQHIGEPIPSWLSRPDGLRSYNVSTSLSMQPTQAFDLVLTMLGTQVNQRNADASFEDRTGAILDDTLTFATEPRHLRQYRERTNTTTGVLGAAFHWRPLSWWTPSATGGLTRTSGTEDDVRWVNLCNNIGCDFPLTSRGVRRLDQSSYTVTLRSDFPLTLGGWERFLSVKPSIGFNLRKDFSNSIQTFGDTLSVGSLDLQTARLYRASSLERNTATAGYDMNADIGAFERYFVTVGFRRDIGSALSRRISPPTYPQFGTSWLISNEPFFPKNHIVSTLRLRVSFGISAVQPDVSATRGTYFSGIADITGVSQESFHLVGLGNYRLKPEKAAEVSYGFDADLFSTRTQIGLTITTKHNSNELIQRTLAPSAGVENQYTENIAKVFNRSVDMTLDSRIIDRDGLLLTGHIAVSTLFNRVDKIGTGILPFGGSDARIVEGFPLFGIWSRPVLGYNDVNGDGVLQSSEIVIGDSVAYVGWPYPKYTLTYSSSLSLLRGRLNLTADVAYDDQQTIYQVNYDGWGAQDIHAPLPEQARYWISHAMDPFGFGHTAGNRQTISILRFNTASATWILPGRLTRRLRANTATLALLCKNLGLWTNYRGRDPGVNSSPVGESITDNGTTIPQPRVYEFSLRLNF